jgi:endonuclease-3
VGPRRPKRPRTASRRKARAREIAPILAREYPDTSISLGWEGPLQLLVATILSAQCTDARVNAVTPELFERWPTAGDLAAAEPAELEAVVRPTGFFRNKSKHIRAAARKIVEEHGGEVPRTMDELTGLPGVARKTANVVLSNAFDRHEGVVVDTHVKRVAKRLGLTDHADPVKVERDLMEILPPAEWRPFAFRLILHGRRTCTARRPACGECPLAELCPSAHTFGPARPAARPPSVERPGATG